MRATALIVLVIYILKILISSVVLDSSAFLQRTVVVNHDALRLMRTLCGKAPLDEEPADGANQNSPFHTFVV